MLTALLRPYDCVRRIRNPPCHTDTRRGAPLEEEVGCSVEVCWSEAVKREDADLADAVMRSNACCEAKPRWQCSIYVTLPGAP